jgi:hypothetical protein
MMKLLKTGQGVVLEVYVKPGSQEFKIMVEQDEVVVHCRLSPVKGKVNREVVKELSRAFGRKVEIVTGLMSRQKRILIREIGLDEVMDTLSKFKDEKLSAD